jgi:NADPH:quinone reductase-like Zn-dependent oxidoreductase
MKAVVIEEFGDVSKLHVRDVEKPIPLDDEVLIRVAYAGVNPVDWKIREGYLQDLIPHDFPIILGWDAAGVIAEIGKNVTNLSVGDEVYSYVRKDRVKYGAYAEYVAFKAKDVVKKPKGLSMAEAASLPLVSLTAWQSLFVAAGLKKTEKILILGGSGGVGSMGIQFAKNVGAYVITTASSKKHDYVERLGADVAIDYKDNVIERVRKYAPGGVDVVFDCFGGAAFKEGVACVRKGGRIVSILERLDPQEAKRLGIEAKYVFVSPSGKDLTSITELVEQKKVVPPHIEEMSIRDVAMAQEKLRLGNVLGKIVLKMDFAK